jgi:hypothetical protein
MTRTTVILDDSLNRKIRAMAFKEHKTFKDTIVELLQRGLNRQKPVPSAPKFKWNVFKSGGASVPIHDRNAVFAKLDGER